jgi:hypothetical protein
MNRFIFSGIERLVLKRASTDGKGMRPYARIINYQINNKEKNMSKSIRLSVITMAMIVCGAPIHAQTGDPIKVSCNVGIDYIFNGGITESYQKSFIVQPGVGFVDDFSTATRLKEFSASTVLDAGKTVIGIRYFNDVGVFNTVDFSTKLTLHKRGIAETTSGSHSFITTQTGPQQEHTTNYTLTCLQAR